MADTTPDSVAHVSMGGKEVHVLDEPPERRAQ
jgi:hypothetical protein